jgi:hypothetical protein
MRDISLGVVSAYALVLADSRTGEIATILGLLSAFVIALLTRSRFLQKTVIIPWVLFSAIILTATAIPIFVAAGTVQVSVSPNDRYSGSTAGRVEIWQAGINEFQHNQLTGAGLASTFRSSSMADDADSLFYYHTVLINYLAKGGVIVGAALILLLILPPWAILVAARRLSYERDTIRYDRGLVLFAISGCVVTIVYATTEAALQNIYPSFIIFFFSAMLAPRGFR